MKIKLIATLLACSGLALAAGAQAQDKAAGGDVLKAKGCLNCHDMDKKKVGPAIKDIAKKGGDRKDELVAKLKGAKGHPKVNASEAEIQQAVEKMLAAK